MMYTVSPKRTLAIFMPLKGKALGCVSRHSYYLRVSPTNQNLPYCPSK